MRCKLDSTENPRSFEKYPTPPGNRNHDWWGDFSQLVKIEKVSLRVLGILRHKVELRF